MGSSELALTARSVLALALLAAAGESGVARAAPATCTADEVTLFSCPSRGKVVSICAIKGWSAASGYVEYRYGRKGDAEIVVPARTAASAPGKSVKVARLPLSGGGVAYAAFPAGRYDYAVYSAITRQGPKSGVARGWPNVSNASRGAPDKV